MRRVNACGIVYGPQQIGFKIACKRIDTDINYGSFSDSVARGRCAALIELIRVTGESFGALARLDDIRP